VFGYGGRHELQQAKNCASAWSQPRALLTIRWPALWQVVVRDVVRFDAERV